MPQTFQAPAALLVRVLVVVALVAAASVIVGLWAWDLADDRVGLSAPQPIPFSHKHHVGDVGLDCRFCHSTVEAKASPGMPSAQLCLTCHSQLFADQAVFEPLRTSLASGRAIEWRHVNRLPDYVYFDHSVHIAKQVACIECHGRVDQQPLIAKPVAQRMRWCLACHENPAPHLHPAGDVFSMRPAELQPAELDALHRLLRIEPRERLANCSTCHR